MAKSLLERKKTEIKHLDAATQAIIINLNKNDYRLRLTAFVTLAIVATFGTIGIYYQIHLAAQSKQHIDCIIKDLATPLPPGSRSKYITNLQSQCNIKFTP